MTTPLPMVCSSPSCLTFTSTSTYPSKIWFLVELLQMLSSC
jgi:hypothetical protein